MVRDKQVSLYLYSPKYCGEICVEKGNGLYEYEGIYKLGFPVKLELAKSPELENYIFELANEGTIHDEWDMPRPISKQFQVLVTDENLQLYRLLFGGTSETPYETLLETNSITNRNDFTPVCFFPPLDFLGFTSDELNQFEKLNKPTPKEDSRQINNLLRVFLGFASRYNKYGTEEQSGAVYNDIQDMLAREGVVFDIKTIKKWLEKASELSIQKEKK